MLLFGPVAASSHDPWRQHGMIAFTISPGAVKSCDAAEQREGMCRSCATHGIGPALSADHCHIDQALLG